MQKCDEIGNPTDSHEPSWGTTMALDFSSVGDRADSNMQVNEIMFKVQICHVMIFDCKKFNSPHYIAINLPIFRKSSKNNISTHQLNL